MIARGVGTIEFGNQGHPTCLRPVAGGADRRTAYIGRCAGCLCFHSEPDGGRNGLVAGIEID